MCVQFAEMARGCRYLLHAYTARLCRYRWSVFRSNRLLPACTRPPMDVVCISVKCCACRKNNDTALIDRCSKLRRQGHFLSHYTSPMLRVIVILCNSIDLHKKLCWNVGGFGYWYITQFAGILRKLRAPSSQKEPHTISDTYPCTVRVGN